VPHKGNSLWRYLPEGEEKMLSLKKFLPPVPNVPRLTRDEVELAFEVINKVWEEDSQSVLSPEPLAHLEPQEWTELSNVLLTILWEKDQHRLQ
jgi:hypothetical protein